MGYITTILSQVPVGRNQMASITLAVWRCPNRKQSHVRPQIFWRRPVRGPVHTSLRKAPSNWLCVHASCCRITVVGIHTRHHLFRKHVPLFCSGLKLTGRGLGHALVTTRAALATMSEGALVPENATSEGAEEGGGDPHTHTLLQRG